MDIATGMRKARRFVASFSLMAIMLGMFATTAAASSFTDVPSDAWFKTYVDTLVENGIVDDGAKFYPERSANRAEAVKVLVEAAGITIDTTSGPSFSDVASGAWYYSYVETAVKNGLVSGYRDANGNLTGKFGPGDDVTREQFAKMAKAAFSLEEMTDGAGFPDVPSTHWSYADVMTLWNWSVIDGYSDGTFKPMNKINRAEISKMVVGGMNPVIRTDISGSVLQSAVAKSATMVELTFDRNVDTVSGAVVSNYVIKNAAGVALTVKSAVVNGDMVTLTTATQEEGEAYTLTVVNVMAADGETSLADVADFSGYSLPIGGDLNVSLASDTPTTTTVPSNATAVELMKFNLTAASSDVLVRGITIHKAGVSALPSTFEGYLYNGNDRLTSGKSLNSSTDNMVFTNLNLTIPKGETLALTFRADMGTIASSGDVRFQVAIVDSNSQSVAGLPVTGEQFGLSTTTVGTVTVYKNGTITNPKVGEDGVTIAKFKVSADTEAANLKQFGLYISGTVSTDDIQNLKLYVSGQAEPLATVASINSKDVAAFVLATPYMIEKGGTKSFTVSADFNTGRNGDVIKAYIDENTDIQAVGDKYGFGMQVDTTTTGNYDGTSCTSTSGDCSYATLEGGDITISSNGPTASDIAVNSKDVTLLNFNITSVSDVTFKNFGIGMIASAMEGTTSEAGLLKDSNDTANITDIKIIDTKTGSTLMGPVDVTSFKSTSLSGAAITTTTDAAQAYYLFTDEFSLNAGESMDLAITADVANNTSLNNETLVASLQLGTTYPEIRDVNNKVLTNGTSLVPSSTVTGKTMTVKSSGLTLTLASTPVSKTYVKGTKDIKFAGFTFGCGTASDCTVTDLTLTGKLDEEGDFNDFTAGTDNNVLLNSIVGSVRLEDGSGKVLAAAKSVQSTGTVSFTNMSWNVKAGDSPTLYVVGDLSTNAFANDTADNVSFAITSTSNVTVEDKDGNSISGVSGTPNSSNTTYVTSSAGGSLTVAVDAATPKENIAIAGAADQVISKFKFTTTDESFVVKKLAINNRQESATTANLGNYDNNVTSVKLSYTNSSGVTETKTGTLTNGTAEFSGLDMFVDADDDAVLTVSANFNTISGGAQAGEFVDLNLAFENFEAVAQGSGETYKGGKIDGSLGASSDLDFGTITWTAGSHDVNLAVTTLAAVDGAQTLMVDDQAAGNPANLPVGTLLCVSADTTCSGESIMVVTGWTDGTVWTDGVTGDSVTTMVLDNADTAFANNDNIVYALPGTGYLTSANQMHVYESKPTITVDGSSPSGSRSVSSTDNAFAFGVAANAQEKVQVRTAKELTTCAAGLDGAGANNSVTTSATSIDGSSCIATTTNFSAGDTVGFDAGATSTINQYARASFWMQVSDAAQFADIKYGTDAAAAATGGIDNIATLGASDCTISGATSSATFVAGSWYFCDVAVPSATTTEQYWHFELDEATELAAADTILVDRLVLYNDKIELDITGDDIDTQTNGAHGLVAYLKEGGATVATGYVAKTTSAAAEGGAAKVAFYPIEGTDAAIEVSKGTSKAFTVQLSTTLLLAEDAGSEDPLTFSMDLGTSTTGTVTAGDFWWNDTNFSSATAGDQPGTSYALTTPGIIKWVGQVSNSTLSGNTVKY